MAYNILAEQHVPGLAAIVAQNNKTVFCAGYGVRDVSENIAVTPDKVFHNGALELVLFACATRYERIGGIRVVIVPRLKIFLGLLQDRHAFALIQGVKEPNSPREYNKGSTLSSVRTACTRPVSTVWVSARIV